MIQGADVSHYEPEVNWAKAKAGGCLFMSTKITDGVGGVDPMRLTHLKDAQNGGIEVRGGYHFFHPSMDGELQAEHFLATCKGLPINWYCLDFEAHENKATSVQLSEAKAFLQKCEAVLGQKPWVYLSTSFADELGNPLWLADYRLWLANYNKTPRVPAPWAHYDAWQNSESGLIAGLGPGHHVDTDWFNGSLDDFKAELGI